MGFESMKWFRGVAQLAEHRFPKPGVAGSIPAAPVTESINKQRY